MTLNPLCARCVQDCKQHESVRVVSCPAFKAADKNLELFDLKGNIRVRAVNKKPRAARKSSSKPDPTGIEFPE